MSQRARKMSENNAILAQAALDTAIDKSPSALQPYLKQLEPVVLFIVKIFVIIDPWIAFAWKKGFLYGQKFYAFIEPYHPDLLASMALGLVMMLFGGEFMLLIACAEGYRICGWETTYKCLKGLYNDYVVLEKADAVDDKLDGNGDGVPDVLEISEKDLIARKVKLFMRSSNPMQISQCLSGIYQGWVAVAAVLRMEFARYVALGVGIGEIISSPALKLLHPVLVKLVPADYEKWVEFSISYSCKCVGVWIAVFLARIITAFHSAVRGAHLFAKSLAVYASRYGFPHLTQPYVDDALAAVIAFFGVWIQLKTLFSVPFLLKLPLLPAIVAEDFLSMWLANDAQ
jgi:hypothetical protein